MATENEEVQRFAAYTVIRGKEAITPEDFEKLIEKFRAASKSIEGGFGLTAPQMMEIADEFSLPVKKLVRSIIRRRYSFPRYCETPGLYQLDQMESMLRWYERKWQHRNDMLKYAGNLEAMSSPSMQQYILETVVPSMERINSEFWITAFSLVCAEGAFMSCPSSQPNLISVKKLLISTILDEIDEAVSISDTSFDGGTLSWYSIQNIYNIVNHYRILDEDRRGMLSYDDFFRIGNLNRLFIKGFWYSPKCYKFPREATDGEIVYDTDLAGLICFERALFYITTFCNEQDTPDCPMEYNSILLFVFRCLSENYENYWTLEYFNHIINNLRIAYIEMDPSSAEDFLLEDMRNIFLNFLDAKDPNQITFDDVMQLDSKLRPGSKSASALFLGMLVDARKLQAYENRENTVGL